MSPFGGPTTRGFDTTPDRLAEMARVFRAGTSEQGSAQAFASGDVAALVTADRLRAEVGGLPEQDRSRRVTQVFCRDGPGWLLEHRHADPLVRGIGLGRAAAIAHG